MKRLIPVTLSLVLLLFVSAWQVIAIEIVKADNASIIWHSTGGADWYYGTVWANETNEAIAVCGYIEDLFDDYRNYERLDHYYDDEVTTSAIYSVTEDCNDYNYATVFNYAHGGYVTWYGLYVIPPFEYYWVPVMHYRYFAYGGESNSIYDAYLYPYTSSGSHQFVFQWTCAQANEIGWYDYDWIDEYGWAYYIGTGAVGMAYAWTQMDYTQLSSNGYASPDSTDYCFIGFQDWSKPLCDNATTGKTYGDFVEKFYRYVLQDDYAVNDALDAASDDIWSSYDTFDETPLYNGYSDYLPGIGWWSGKMRVFGNGNNVIP